MSVFFAKRHVRKRQVKHFFAGTVASRIVRDVTDGVNELLNDLPTDKLRNDVQKIARLLGGPPRYSFSVIRK